VISGVSRSLCQRSPSPEAKPKRPRWDVPASALKRSTGAPRGAVEEGREVVRERRQPGEHHVPYRLLGPEARLAFTKK